MGFRFGGPTGTSGRPPEVIDAGTTQPVENHAPGLTDVLKAAGRVSPLALLGPAGIAATGLATVAQLYYSKNLDALAAVRDRAATLAPAAIAEATGFDELGKLFDALLSGLLATMIALAASSALGGAIGGVVGFFFGGVGAAPGAVVGAKAGFEIGLAILTWMGVGFLAASIASGLGELISLLPPAVRRGWAAGDFSGPRRAAEIELAAQQLARAAGLLIRLILEGILAYLARGAAISTTRAVTGTINQTRTAGSKAVAAETVAELVKNLRKSNLGRGFADWVELNWQKLLDNPKLRRNVPEIKPQVATGATRSAATPSQAGNSGQTDTIPQRDEPPALSSSTGSESSAAKGLTTADFPNIAAEVSQKQLRHIAGRPELAARGGGSYLNSKADAQAVLDAYHSGSATILGKSSQGFPVVRVDSVSGTNVNVGAGFPNQSTNVFIIKGTASPSVIPTNPNWTP